MSGKIKLIQNFIRIIIKRIIDDSYRNQIKEIKRLKKIPRYQIANTDLMKNKIEIIDSASFLSAYQAIFDQQIYEFQATKKNPRIIDGGANIGLSIIYFKNLYPDSSIIAFEADPFVFNTLKNNLDNWNITDVEVHNTALWSEKTTLKFKSDRADSGRLINKDNQKYINVKTEKLSAYLEQPIDFLKLDIEGAETQVLCDCRHLLCNVNMLFVEYHSYCNEKQSVHTIINCLQESGFRLYIHSDHVASKPFVDSHEHNDIDMTLNIFALRKNTIKLTLD